MKKFLSRKFITAIIPAIAGLIVMFIGHEAEVNVISGALMTIVPAIVYCIVEGKIDAENVKAVTDATADAAEKLGFEEVSDKIEAAGEVIEIITETAVDGDTEANA